MRKAQKMNWQAYSARTAMHEDAECYGDGDYCVYFWADRTGDVFYVGSGKYYRFQQATEKCRPTEFMRIYNRGGCRPWIVAYGMDRLGALQFEERLIREFVRLKFPLVNKQGVTSPFYYTGFGVGFGRLGEEVKGFEKFLKKQKDGEMTVKECCDALGIGVAKWYREVNKRCER